MLAKLQQTTGFFSNRTTTVATRLIKAEHDYLSLRVHPSSSATQRLPSRSLLTSILAMRCMTTEVFHAAPLPIQTVTDKSVQHQIQPEQALRNQLSADVHGALR
jgi:hypothetical protein